MSLFIICISFFIFISIISILKKYFIFSLKKIHLLILIIFLSVCTGLFIFSYIKNGWTVFFSSFNIIFIFFVFTFFYQLIGIINFLYSLLNVKKRIVFTFNIKAQLYNFFKMSFIVMLYSSFYFNFINYDFYLLLLFCLISNLLTFFSKQLEFTNEKYIYIKDFIRSFFYLVTWQTNFNIVSSILLFIVFSFYEFFISDSFEKERLNKYLSIK